MSTQNLKNNNHRIEQILQFLKTSPEDCFLLHALALENIKIGNEDEAQKVFEKVLQIDEKYVGTYYHLGKLLERKNLDDEAIKIYEKGIEIAKEKKDNHSKNELQGALDGIIS
jgi:tetratricopeptide (TPR) repeat protein